MMRDRKRESKDGEKKREGDEEKEKREREREDGVLLAGAHQMKWIGGQLNRKAL